MSKCIRRAPVVALLAAFLMAAPLPGGDEGKTPKEKPTPKGPASAPARRAVEVRYVDDSTMKITLQCERFELVTPYGKLLIPAADIHQIDFGMRIPGNLPKRIDVLIEDLGAKEFQKRESASAGLWALREKAYRHLLQAAKQKDPEVVRRAEELLDRIREAVPADLLEAPTHDVVYTEDSKIAGHLTATTLKVTTFQFGEQELKLADLRGLRSLALGADSANALLDPGNLSALQGQAGKTFSFKVTGAQRGNHFGGGVWGSGVYTSDSCLALAAVHAGALRPGQTGVVRVTILGPQAEFQGSTRNGVTSTPFGPYSGYKIIK
jgi:hypothetical protein